MIASNAAALCLLSLLLYLLTISSAIPSPRKPPHSLSTSLPSTVSASVRAILNRSSAGCLRRFSDHTHEYDGCMRKPCFIFLQEEPYIILDPAMKTDMQTKVFPCNSSRKVFKLLGGTAFDIIAKTAASDALCVWGGPDCLFNNAINFIDEHSGPNSSYKFAFTGLLLEQADRIRPTVIKTVSIRQENLAIFGPRIPTGSPFPLWRLVHPFQLSAWVLWFILIITFILLFWISALVFVPKPLNFNKLLEFVLDDPATTCAVASPTISVPNDSIDTMPGGPDPEYNTSFIDRALSYRFARKLLKVAIGTTSLIFFVFYEIAVVNFLFIQMSAPNLQDLTSLSDTNLRRFAVEKNAATEDVFIQKVYRNKVPKELPWRRCETEQLCFDWALEKRNKVQYVVTFRSTGIYNLLQRDTCDNMTLYETKTKIDSFGAGWMFGSTVNSSLVNQVNRDILEMRENGDLPELIEKAVGTLDNPKCTPEIKSIDERIVGISVLVLVVPFLSAILLVIGVYVYMVRKSYEQVRTSKGPRNTSRISVPDKAYCPLHSETGVNQSKEIERLSAVTAIMQLSLRKDLTSEEEKTLSRSIDRIRHLFCSEKRM